MQYIIDYLYYKVSFKENIGLYKKFRQNIGMHFGISEIHTLNKVENLWKIEIQSGILDQYQNVHAKKIKFEHNLEGFFYEQNDARIFISINEDWIIKFLYEQSLILIDAVNVESSYFIILKILKQISRYENYIRNHILLHASCIVKQGEGYVFMGEKSAGKTTVMVNLLKNNQDKYQYLGNDIVILDKKLTIYSIFSKVGIGAATLEFLNERRENKIPIRNANKYYYELKDFIDIFQVECTNKAELAGIFILSKSNIFHCDLIQTDKVEGLIKAHILLDGKDEELTDHPDWMQLMPLSNEKISLENICKEISQLIPCYNVQYRINCREDYEQIDSIIQTVKR